MSEQPDNTMRDFNILAANAVNSMATAAHIVPGDFGVSAVSDPASGPLSGVLQGPGGDNGTVLVPSVTEDELENSTSSNGKKMVAVRVPVGINPAHFRVAIAVAYMQYIVDGHVDIGGMVSRCKLSENKLSLILSTPEFRTACSIRGMELTGTTGLTAEQDYALQIILDTSDSLTFGMKLKKAGISNSKWRAWLQNPLIRAHYARVSEGLLNDSTPAILALVGKVNDGDLAAIKFQLEMNGRYNPNKNATLDVMAAMNKVMEIIMVNVTNKDELIAIAGQMKDLGNTLGLVSNTQRTIEG